MSADSRMVVVTAARPGRLPFVLLPLVLFVLIPAFLLKENVQDLADFDPRAFLLLSLAAAGTSLLLLASESVLRRVTGSGLISAAVELLFFFSLVTGFVLPASKSAGMTDPARLDIDAIHVAVASLLALAMLRVSRSRHRGRLYLAALFFLALNAALTVPTLYALSRGGQRTEQAIFGISSDTNILVLSFDGVPGPAVREVLAESPELAERFAGFTFYDRVASSSPATSASTAASLYGNRNFKESSGTADALWTSAPHWLLTNNLNDHGYEVSTHGIYNTEFADRDRRHGRLAPRPPPSTLMLLNYSLARALTRFAVLRGDAADSLESRVERALTPLSADDLALLEQISASRSPKWKRRVETPTVLDFYAYVRRLHVVGARPVAHFLHFTYSHYPVEFDRGCRFRGHDRQWFKGRQSWEGVKEEVFCVLTQASRFIDKLKALGAFDQSLVVLKSDHGKPVAYGKPGSIDALGIRGHPKWGYGRYRPFLALKGFGPGAGAVRHDDHPVMLDDLPKTVCLHAAVEMSCSAYGGYDLLGRDFTGIADAEVTMFVVESERGSYRYDDHEAITIRRQADVVESLHAALTSGK